MPNLPQPANFYAGNRFDRLTHRRGDAQWLAQQLQNGEVALLPLWQGRHLIAGGLHAPQLATVAWPTLMPQISVDQLVLLGEFRGRICFAVALPGEQAPPLGEFHDLRQIGGQMDHDEAGLLGYARALVLWQERNRYCGRCAAATTSINAGHTLKCSNPACGLAHFPRLDPAIIVLVTDGERVLLGRQAHWPAGRYSTLAGYVEWAESIEEAVVREVFEEAGVQVDAVEYHSSQPWPFPSSLMLGFIAHAASTDIQRLDGELEDARWFSRADLANGAVLLPPPQAVSYRLIENWYQRGGSALRDSAARVASFTQPSRE